MSSYRLSENINLHVVGWWAVYALYRTGSAVVGLLHFIRGTLPLVRQAALAALPDVLTVCKVVCYVGGFLLAFGGVLCVVVWLCANPHVILCGRGGAVLLGDLSTKGGVDGHQAIDVTEAATINAMFKENNIRAKV